MVHSTHALNVKSNLGREFLDLMDKYYPVNHKRRKIINRRSMSAVDPI